MVEEAESCVGSFAPDERVRPWKIEPAYVETVVQVLQVALPVGHCLPHLWAASFGIPGQCSDSVSQLLEAPGAAGTAPFSSRRCSSDLFLKKARQRPQPRRLRFSSRYSYPVPSLRQYAECIGLKTELTVSVLCGRVRPTEVSAVGERAGSFWPATLPFLDYRIEDHLSGQAMPGVRQTLIGMVQSVYMMAVRKLSEAGGLGQLFGDDLGEVGRQ